MKSLTKHLNRLVSRYGTYSDTARAVGVTPRALRQFRRNLESSALPANSPIKNLLVAHGKLLALQGMVAALRADGTVTDDQIRHAWATASVSERPPHPKATAASASTDVARKGEKHHA
jgi:hypothetical protein